jgi:hypothetical protein
MREDIAVTKTDDLFFKRADIRVVWPPRRNVPGP